jgi:release factor glutamine methyltransferase
MTIRETLARGTTLLKEHRIESPGLDAALLLAETLHTRREKLIQRGPDPLPEAECRHFFQLIDRRRSGECTAYILGRKEFRGLDFLVNPAVLVPRPDTETLVEAALEKLATAPSSSLLDLCTGSGAVAISLKHECPGLEVFASDLSPQALETARINAARLLGTELLLGTEPESTGPGCGQGRQHGDPVPALTFILSDLFDRIPRRFHLITANPPYIRTGDMEELPPEVQGEPRLALDGGEDGLDIIRAIISQAPDHLFPGGLLLLEVDPRQMSLVTLLLKHQGFMDIQTHRDLSGAERVAAGRLGEESRS